MDNEHSLEEIINFINLTPFKTDFNLFERLNSQEILNIYINCLIYIGKAKDYDDFEINDQEELYFATVVKENSCPKIIKVTAILNKLFKQNGYPPTFSPVYILSPNLNTTISTLGRLLDIKNKIEENKRQYILMGHDYKELVESSEQMTKRNKEDQRQKEMLLKAIEEGNQINEDLEKDIKVYGNKINEIEPQIENNKETSKNLLENINKKDNQLKELKGKFDERLITLNKLKEHIVSSPEKLNKDIENNQIILNEYENKIKEAKNYLDNIFNINDTISKILDKLLALNVKIEEYDKIEDKNNQLKIAKEENKTNISKLGKENLISEKNYKKTVEDLKKTDQFGKDQLKDINNYKLKINQQIKENKDIKNRLKETLDQINNANMKNQSELDKIIFEKNEIDQIRDKYALYFAFKFQEIENKQKEYFKKLNESLEKYKEYDIGRKIEEGKNSK